MKIYDLGIAFVWEYDDDFVFMLEDTLQRAGYSTFRIDYKNFPEVESLVTERKLGFRFYLDRAADVDSGFERLGKVISRRRTTILNPYKNVQLATDKASMHLEFITVGLEVPYSIIIPPHSEMENIFISVEDLAILGRPFIIKPCNTTGGGIGVVTGAETLKDVLEERILHSNDKYLLQEKIYPDTLNGKRAWFRCFWSFGKVIPVWWDDQTHLYSLMTLGDISAYNLNKLIRITKIIAQLTGLDFFSTEIVLTPDKRFVVIDYVNDQCDMRIKSKHVDGVPDIVVKQIILNLLQAVKKNIQR
jgi:hypothetical protein